MNSANGNKEKLELIKKSKFFSEEYYLKQYPDIKEANIDSFKHYMEFGWKEGRNPSKYFDTNFYLNQYKDVKDANINPLLHYMKFGRKENRVTVPYTRNIYKYFSEGSLLLKIFDFILPVGSKRKKIISNFFRMFKITKDVSLKIRNMEKLGLIDIRNILLTNQDKPGTIAIQLHLYYFDLINEFTNHLKSMPFQYDLYVSVTDESVVDACRKILDKLPLIKKLIIKVVPNRGRDISPMICSFNEDLLKYDFIAHIHTKKSLYNQGATQGWREYLLHNLFGSSLNIKKIFKTFQNDTKIGIIYPQNFKNIPYSANTWLSNKHTAVFLKEKLGVNKLPKGYFNFPASSMFWARKDAILPLLEGKIKLEDFPEEKGQIDATLAHCIERMLGVIPVDLGYKVGIIRDYENYSDSPWRFDSQYFQRSYDYFKGVVSNNSIKLIIFDIFDTLLLRPLLDPEMIKKIVADGLEKKLAEKYLTYRNVSESMAREKANRDIGIDIIYKEFQKLTKLDDSVVEIIKNKELNVEKSLVSKRDDVLEMFNYCKSINKRVILASDMFLSKETIEEMLENNGIRGWDRLYLSSDVGLRKDTVGLYDFILKEENMVMKDILVIGDNEHSDLQIPCDRGAFNFHVLRPVEFARGTLRYNRAVEYVSNISQLNYDISLGIILKKVFSPIFFENMNFGEVASPNSYMLGYSVLGPVIYSFLSWLIENSNELKTERLYFLSREGQFIKKTYDLMVSKGNYSNIPTSFYLILSRRAVTVSSINGLDDIYQIARPTFFASPVETFISERYGIVLSEDEWENIYKKNIWGRNESVEIKNDNIDKIKPLLKEIQHKIMERAEIEKRGMLKYLSDIGLNDSIKSSMVDVGYSATIQDGVNKLINEKVDGLYMMTTPKAKIVSKRHNVTIKGCFIEGTEDNDYKNVPLYKDSFILEKMMSSNDPQLLNYTIDKENKLVCEYRKLTEKEKSSSGIRKEVQDGALSFIEDVLNIKMNLIKKFDIPKDLVCLLFEEFVHNQTESDKKTISELYCDDFYSGRGVE